MAIGGFHGRLLLVDLASHEFGVEPVPQSLYESYLGGRGMAARYYYDRVGPQVDPLAAENELILFTGPLTGIGIPCGTKTALATKSPLTGHYLCSNAGGAFGAQLKAAGFDGVILRGKAARPEYLFIADKGVSFHDALEVWGMPCSQSMRRIREAVGSSSAGVLCIGPAGEQQVRFASVMADDRAFGRGGAGAVMGAKKVKAIAVSGTGGVPIADRKAVDSLVPELFRTVREEKLDLAAFGTSQLTETMNRLGCYPVRNFRTSFLEDIEPITATAMKSKYWVKDSTCYRCPIACGKVCEIKDGAYTGMTARPEYESTWALGGHCGVTAFSAILSAIRLCNEYGLDTMTTGYMVGLAMDLFSEGLIKPADLESMSLHFGDAEAMVRMVEMIGRREGLGRELGEGILPLLEKHPAWSEFAVHVKGSPFAGYDPRAFHGIGLTYGTSSRGACHNVGGWTISDELLSGRYDRFALEGKGELVKRLQDVRAFVDSSGVCTNARRALGLTDKPRDVVLNAVAGLDLTSRLLEIGERTYNLERLCLNREGVTRQDDLLPQRMSVPIPTGPAAGHKLDTAQYEVMLSEYYAAREWNKDGLPTPGKLQKLGLRGSPIPDAC